jgi:hypothetical protein
MPDGLNEPEFPDFRGTRLSMSEVSWTSGEPIEGEQAGISKAVAARVPRATDRRALKRRDNSVHQ